MKHLYYRQLDFKRHWYLMATVLIISSFFSHCTYAGGADKTKRNEATRSFVYITSSNIGKNLTVFSDHVHLDSKPLQSLAVGPGLGTPTINRQRRTLYVPSNDRILQFRIGSDGKLIPLSPSSISMPNVSEVATTSQGNFVIVRQNSGDVMSCRVASDGTLHPTRYRIDYDNATPTSLAVSRDGRYAYVLVEVHSEPIGYVNYLYQYRITSYGEIVPLSPAQVPGLKSLVFPYTIALSPNSQFLYLFSQVSISTYAVSKNGTLVKVTTPSQTTQSDMAAMPHMSPSDSDSNPENIYQVVFDPSGRFAYALCTLLEDYPSGAIRQSIAFAAVGPTGLLSVKQHFYVSEHGRLSIERVEPSEFLTDIAVNFQHKTLDVLDINNGLDYRYKLTPDSLISPRSQVETPIGPFPNHFVWFH
jgi:6-phosphogluconolactonase (cycloisomerase 2 family)